MEYEYKPGQIISFRRKMNHQDPDADYFDRECKFGIFLGMEDGLLKFYYEEGYEDRIDPVIDGVKKVESVDDIPESSIDGHPQRVREDFKKLVIALEQRIKEGNSLFE